MVVHGSWYALYSFAGSYYTLGCDPSGFIFCRVLSSLEVVLRSPCVSPKNYANNDMPFITSPQDS